MSVPDLPPRPPHRVAGVLVALGLLSIVELGLRALGWPPPAPTGRFINEEAERAHAGIDYVVDDELFWRLPPSRTIVGGAYRINALGLRGPEVARPKPASTYRVAVVGDSCTFGLGLDLPDTFGALLETLRGPHDTRVEVVRVGVPGYSSLQSLRLARRVLPLVDADVTVAWVGAFNDAAPACGRSDAQLGAGPRSEALGWLRRLALFRGLGRLVRGDAPACPPERPGAPPRVTVAELRANLRALVRLGRERSDRVVVLVPPALPGTRAAPYAAAVRAFPRAVDPGLVRSPPTRDFQDDLIHPNRTGSVAIARALITPLGLTSGTPPTTGTALARVEEDAARADQSVAALRRGDATSALALLEPMAASLADRPRLLAAHVEALAATGHLDEARARATAALAQYPRFTELRRVYAETLAAAGDEDGAIRELRRALSTDRGWIAGHVALARILLAKGARTEARGALHEARIVAPSSPELRALDQQLGTGSR